MLKHFELDLKKDLSLIVGKNNSGKTSLLTVMDRFLNSKQAQFRWEDFHSDYQKLFYRNLMAENDIANIGGIKQTLFIEYDQHDNFANIQKLMLDLNPDNNVVVLEFSYSTSQEKLSKLKQDLEKKQKTKWEDFMKFMKKYSNRYFFVNTYARGFDIETKQLKEEFSASLDKKDVEKIIKLKSIKADREASNKYNDSSLSSLSSKYYEYLKFNDDDIVENLESTILDTDKSLNKVYDKVFGKITQSVEKFGAAEGDTQLSIQSTLIDKELLSGNTTLYYSHEGINLPESYNGLGHLNLIGMIFEIETIITTFHGKEEEPIADINIIFIEEPEAHTHPQLQYVFIKNIKDLIEEGSKGSKEGDHDLNIQTVMTTHSSHIVSECDFDDIRYLKKEDNYSIAKSFEKLKQKYYDNDDEQIFKFVKQYITLNRSELFFADKVIFIEGDTERLLLPSMLKKRDLNENESTPLLSQNISIIEAGTYAHYFSKLIDFLGVKALIITDIDAVRGSNREGCSPSEAEKTSNPCLKAFLRTDDFHSITQLGSTSKTLKYVTEENQPSYRVDSDGNFRIAYQIEEENNQANSFEDAFINLNLEFIKENRGIFKQGLKKERKFDEGLNAFQLAEQCINKKTAFAMEILLASEVDFSNWQTPKYIEEGLTWLQN